MRLAVTTIVCAALVISGCSLKRPKLPRVHKLTVQQGNVITQRMMDQLKPGMTRSQVARMILAESGMMGLIGGGFGLIFGVLLSRAVLGNINGVTGYELTYVLPAQGVVASAVISLVVSQLAAIWPARRAVTINMIEAIQVE